MGAIAAIAVISGGIQAIGALQQGQAQAAAAKFNAGIAKRNAQLSLDQASADAESQRRKSSKVLGDIEAGFGASGVTGEGSARDVIESSATLAELDRQNILYGGRLKAMGFLQEAKLEKARGRQAITGSRFQTASAVLTAAAVAFAPKPVPAPVA